MKGVQHPGWQYLGAMATERPPGAGEGDRELRDESCPVVIVSDTPRPQGCCWKDMG
jgi:hypothetical protein